MSLNSILFISFANVINKTMTLVMHDFVHAFSMEIYMYKLPTKVTAQFIIIMSIV